ncbi:MAG: hypothetical protein AAGA92_04290 [Planctomycetota bacterium]
MSTAAPPPPAESPQSGPPRKDRLNTVDRDIARTRRSLQRVDLLGGLLTLAIGVLLYLLAVSAMEHWVVPGGWSGPARAGLLALLAAGVVWYAVRRIVPIFLRPINPAFAARAIEDHSPGLKNSLVNLLMLRGHRREIHSSVYQAIEQQTAERLAGVQIDSAVDRAGVLRLGYALAGVVLVCGLYRVLSPKDIFTSATRVLAPWSDIAAPSRVTVTKIEPGDVSVAKGETVEVSAEVLGLAPDEPVVLKYSTADKQAVDRPVTMNSETELDYRCTLPGRGPSTGRGTAGVQQELTYWIEAGDARSTQHKITVFEKPTIVVQSVRYDYPAYTGLGAREDDAGGDLSAVEGTRVTLFALANQPIDAAHVDFAADGRNDLRMQPDNQGANATFKLALREDRRTPQHTSYVLRYRTPGGRVNDDPPKHTIDVTPDYAPETEVLRPDAEVIDVAIGQRVRFEVEARDPDFALSDVALVGEVEGKPLLRKRLLTERHTGRFLGTVAFTPEEIGLQEGQVMEYWSVAQDNRSPEPNLAASQRRKLRVVGGDPRDRHFDKPEQQQGEGQNRGEQEGEPGEQGESNGEGQQGAGSEGGQGEQSGEQSDQQGQSGEGGEPNGDSQQQGQGGEGSGQQEGQEQRQGDQQPGEGGQQGDPSSDGQNQNQAQENNAEPNGNQRQPGEKGGEQKVSSEGDNDGEAFERMRDHFAEQEANDQGQSGDGQQQGTSQQEDGANEQQQPGAEAGDEPTGQQQPGQQQPGQEQSGQPQNGQQQGEQQQGAEQQPGEQQGNQNPREQGDAGAGERQGEPQQSPDPGEGNSPKDKQPSQDQNGEQPEGSAPSGDQGREESDSEGGQDGDQSGGGAEGGGQQADQQGEGASGENTAADSGGQSNEQGPGEDTRPGDQQQADGQTGQSDGQQQPGEGSQQREGQQGDGQQGDQPGGEGQQGQQPEGQGEEAQRPDQQQDGDPQSPQGGEGSNQQDSQQQENPSEQPPEGQASQTPGEGPSNSGGKLSPPPEGELAGADDPTVEFANKQTDMVLDKLEDQLAKKDVDRELLDKLGWNQDELRRFVDRWKNLKSDAAGTGEQATDARRKLDDALRSLGLGKPGDRGFRSVTAKDRLRKLQDSYRGRVPLEFQDDVRAYQKGTASGGKKDD